MESKKKNMYSIYGIKYPSVDKIGNRTSTIARSMASTIAPREETDEETAKDMAKVLGIDANNPTCVYCGKEATQLDHLFPLIQDKVPTGYFSEPSNLVPCCSKCNSSKGAKNWDEFMKKNEESLNGDKNFQERFDKLTIFTKKFSAKRYNPNDDNGFIELWKKEYNEICAKLVETQKRLEDYIYSKSEE